MTAALRHPCAPAIPLPAPTLRVVVRPAPPREPPFDDELGDGLAPSVLDRPLPFERVPVRPVAVLAGRRIAPGPDPAQWARRLLIGLIETADGRRPLHQLATLLSVSVAHGISGDFERSALGGSAHWLHRASVRTVRSSQPSEGVAEVAVTVQTGPRVRAVAMRLELHHGRWRCSRLQLG